MNECTFCMLWICLKPLTCYPMICYWLNLPTYDFDKTSLKLLHSYLSDRMQSRTKITSIFSSWLEICLGVPQGFIILGSTHICNFADDNTIYSSASSTEEVILSLKHDLQYAPKEVFFKSTCCLIW